MSLLLFTQGLKAKIYTHLSLKDQVAIFTTFVILTLWWGFACLYIFHHHKEFTPIHYAVILFQSISFILLFSEYTFRIGIYTLWLIPLLSFIYIWSGLVASAEGTVASMITSMIALIFIVQGRSKKALIVFAVICYLITSAFINRAFLISTIRLNDSLYWQVRFGIMLIAMTHVGGILIYLTNYMSKQNKKIREKSNLLIIQKNKYEQLIRSIKEDYFLFSENTKGELSFISPSFYAVLGHHEIKKIEEVLHTSEETLRWKHSRNRLLKRGRQSITLNFKMTSKNHEEVERVFKIQKSVRLGVEGEILGIDGIAQDITDRLIFQKHLEDALEKERQLNTLKTNLISTVSHQFRTPLTVIQSSTELMQIYLKKESINPPKMEKLTVRVVDTVQYMNEMVDDILFFRSLEASPVLNTECSVQSFSTFIHDLILQYTPLLETDKAIETIILGDDHEFSFDEKLMGYVFGNLLSNAIKYTPINSKNPKIQLQFGEEYVLVQIIDHGIGIKKEDLDKLFTPFFRGENTKNHKGTGLGLAIAKECLDSHKGIITVQSIEGQGSTFKVKLPYQRV